MDFLSPEYWNMQYTHPKTGWDAGSITTPLRGYFDQLQDKSIRILIPGAGNGWEVEYLYRLGFGEAFLLDFAPASIQQFKKRCPEFPDDHIFVEDFFQHSGCYDLIVEQTFFCSLKRELRASYVSKMASLLMPGGKLAGVLFNHEFAFEGPPYGGSSEEYQQLFQPQFEIIHFETAENSIKPRMNREQFILMRKSAQ